VEYLHLLEVGIMPNKNGDDTFNILIQISLMDKPLTGDKELLIATGTIQKMLMR